MKKKLEEIIVDMDWMSATYQSKWEGAEKILKLTTEQIDKILQIKDNVYMYKSCMEMNCCINIFNHTMRLVNKTPKKEDYSKMYGFFRYLWTNFDSFSIIWEENKKDVDYDLTLIIDKKRYFINHKNTTNLGIINQSKISEWRKQPTIEVKKQIQFNEEMNTQGKVFQTETLSEQKKRQKNNYSLLNLKETKDVIYVIDNTQTFEEINFHTNDEYYLKCLGVIENNKYFGHQTFTIGNFEQPIKYKNNDYDEIETIKASLKTFSWIFIGDNICACNIIK